MNQNCNSCRVGFSISHALDLNRGDLVTSFHNKLCDRVSDLYCKSLTITHMEKNMSAITKIKGNPLRPILTLGGQ